MAANRIPSIVFDSLAQFFDLVWGGDEHEVEFWVESIGKTNRPVLELAIGTGRITTGLADAGVRVVGIDFSLSMLQRAANTLNEKSLKRNVELLQADAHHLPIAPCSFSMIVAAGLFYHLPTF